MRPERIRLSAFGAYAGEQEIDFSALAGHRLFLIHGPTGAGKTTLLDAICFALFGESSGDERGAGDLRSHHAAPELPTAVEFDFILGTEAYRIRRTPAQLVLGSRGRPVRRGAEVTLWRRDATGALAVLAEQATPVRDRLDELLGYSAAEFRQVVMLPQGRFRELLVAERDVRADILATLFRTALYRRVEEELQAMERAAREEARQAETRRATLLAEAAAESIDDATVRAEALSRLAGERAAQAAEAARRRSEAEARLASARADAETIRRAEEARARLAAIEAEAEANASAAARLEAARRAQALGAEQAALDAALAEASRAAAARGDAAEALGRAQARALNAAAALADAALRDQAAEATAAEATRLEALAGQAEALAKSEAAAAEAEAARRGAETEAHAAVQRRETAAQRLAEALTVRDATRALAERVEERRAAHALGEARAADSRAWRSATERESRLATDVSRAEAALAAAVAAASEASTARAAEEHAAWAEAASRLAAGLAKGQPCPVCGSLDHPSPAQRPDRDAVDLDAARAREEAARQAERTAQAALSHALAAHASAEAERDALARRIGEPEPEERLAEAIAAARASLAEAEKARAEHATLIAEAEAAAAADASAAAEAGRASDALRAAGERHARAAGAHAALREQLPPEARDGATLAQRIADARRGAQALRDALGRDRAEQAAAGAACEAAEADSARAEARRQQAAQAAEAASARFLAACTRAGFAGPEASREAMLAEEDITALDASIRDFGERRAAAREQAAAAAGMAASLSPPDLPAREADAEDATRKAHEAGTAEGMARAEAAAERLARLRAADEAFAMARERLDRTAAIATAARGQNRLRMSFEDFVLASLLDEALSAANDHLARMLAGRFRLLRRAEPDRANARAGLDIEVFDEWTGQARPAGTLSGGEGFCAALALALGLSETVQAHAGARRIDTLLIDEGFGSLDEDALDKAMDVLSTLPGSDRIVGIISHVGELKQRITARLEVSPGTRGSTARFVLG